MARFIAKFIAKKRRDTFDNDPELVLPRITYDTSLPTQHSYLGNDLEELSGRTLLDDDSLQELPIISLPGVMLVPGQILPLQLYNPETIRLMREIITRDRTFGMVNARYTGSIFSNLVDTLGTTVEIRSYREDRAEYGVQVLRIKAEGRQRFEVIDTKRTSEGIVLARVHILPELFAGDPSECSKLNSLNKFRVPPPNIDAIKPENEFRCTQLLHRSSQKYNKYDFANYSHFPEFVYKMYDPQVLMKRIQRILGVWNRVKPKGGRPPEAMPCDPKEFSYWVAANLPLNDQQRMRLLRINEVVLRLRHELRILEERCVIICRDCLSTISSREDIFSMSLQGPQGTYVNNNGYVHECITVAKAKGLHAVGRASTEQSWFPGYAWTIMECSHCNTHIGWMFTNVDKSLEPAKFWALSRQNIETKIASKPEPRSEAV